MSRNGRHITDAFWGDDFNTRDGYNAVNKRMLDGIETCKNVAALIRQRGKYEEEFAKSFQKTFKSAEGNFNNEIGKLRDSLDSFRRNGEDIATDHLEASKELMSCADRLQELSTKLKNDWSNEKDKIKKVIQEKQRYYERASNTKKTYMEKSKAAEQAEVTARFSPAQTNPNMVEKNAKAFEKAKQEAEKADQCYREAVRLLDDARVQWEKDLHRYYQFCEDQDKHRMMKLQEEIWIMTNICSLTYVNADKKCEDVRISLEGVDPAVDISEFVEKNQTGTRKPAAIPYEPYKNHIIQDKPNGTALRGPPRH